MACACGRMARRRQAMNTCGGCVRGAQDELEIDRPVVPAGSPSCPARPERRSWTRTGGGIVRTSVAAVRSRRQERRAISMLGRSSGTRLPNRSAGEHYWRTRRTSVRHLVSSSPTPWLNCSPIEHLPVPCVNDRRELAGNRRVGLLTLCRLVWHTPSKEVGVGAARPRPKFPCPKPRQGGSRTVPP